MSKITGRPPAHDERLIVAVYKGLTLGESELIFACADPTVLQAALSAAQNSFPVWWSRLEPAANLTAVCTDRTPRAPRPKRTGGTPR